MSTNLSFTRFTAITPKRLSKRFILAGDTLVKEGGGNMADGIAERLTVADLAEFAALLTNLRPNQALTYGINGHDRARVIPKDAPTHVGDDLPVIHRTRDHFHWPEGAGLLMLDYDPAPDGKPLGVDELHAALATACPVLADAPAIWRPSASSCIHDRKTGAELRGVGGQRLYIPVLGASDISRAGAVLFDRLWLAGHGRFEVSKSGALLARSLIDASVFQPERLDFCGGADLGRGLEQRLPDPVLFNESAPYLDTRAELPDLTAEEESRLAAIRSEFGAALEAERQQVREIWIAERVAAGLADLPEERRETIRPRLEVTYRQAAEGGRLGLDFELVAVKKGGKIRKALTVHELLRDRAAWHEATTTDPLEQDYPDGQARLVGWLNLRAREPYLQSQAHGGIRYWLGDESQATEPPPLDDDGYLDAIVADAQQVQQTQAPDRGVTIQLTPGALPETVDQAEVALCAHEPNFFQRGGQLVRWCANSAETVRGITRPGGAVTILNQDPDYLLDQFNRLIRWERWDSKKEDYKCCNAPRTVATTLLARRGHWKAKPLVAVINSPTLRPDGSILDQPGYDEATGLLFVNNAVEFESIPQRPTREQALAALTFLKDEVLIGFPFKENHDRSAALSAILTAIVRHALKAAPMHTFNAPVMASGKSLLADVAALIATGHPATVMSFTPDGDEMRKRILSVLMQGDLVVNLDNIEEPLANQTLCSVLTQETFTDRILGSNKTGTAPTLCCWQATGNNLVIAGDLTTRIVPCNLDPKVERPEEREFERNLYDWIPAHRPRLIREALTVLRAYVVAGKPKQPIKNFARFEDWSGLVRSALVWLGEADPLTGREAIEDGDPIRVKLRALLTAWHATFKSAPATSREAVCRANETELDEEGTERPCYPIMREALEEHFTDKSGRANSRYLGEFLKKYAGRVETGAKFDTKGTSQRAVNWRVAIVDKSRFAKFADRGETDSLDSRDSPQPQSASGNKSESGESGESVRHSRENFSDDNRQQPPAEPPPDDLHAARVAELIASGWSPWNATARARSEASQRAKAGAHQ